MDIKKKKILKYILIFFIAFFIFFLFWKISVFRELIYLFIISILVTYTLKPIQLKLVDIGINKSISALIVIGIIILIFILSSISIIPYFLKKNLDVKNALDNVQNVINNIYDSLKPIRNSGIFHTITDNMYSKLHNLIIDMSEKLYEVVMNLSSILIYAIIIPIVVYYLLADGKIIEHGFLRLFPVKSRNTIYKISCHIDKILGRYIVSQLILSLFVGIATFIILIILKVDFPIILSLINAIFNIIPYFGPIFGAFPAIFIGFINSPRTAVEVAIWLYVLQQIEGNILCPKITADSVDMHPLTVIVLLLIGEKVAGFVGMVAAVPLGVAIKIIYRDLSYYIF